MKIIDVKVQFQTNVGHQINVGTSNKLGRLVGKLYLDALARQI